MVCGTPDIGFFRLCCNSFNFTDRVGFGPDQSRKRRFAVANADPHGGQSGTTTMLCPAALHGMLFSLGWLNWGLQVGIDFIHPKRTLAVHDLHDSRECNLEEEQVVQYGGMLMYVVVQIQWVTSRTPPTTWVSTTSASNSRCHPVAVATRRKPGTGATIDLLAKVSSGSGTLRMSVLGICVSLEGLCMMIYKYTLSLQ